MEFAIHARYDECAKLKVSGDLITVHGLKAFTQRHFCKSSVLVQILQQSSIYTKLPNFVLLIDIQFLASVAKKVLRIKYHFCWHAQHSTVLITAA